MTSFSLGEKLLLHCYRAVRKNPDVSRKSFWFSLPSLVVDNQNDTMSKHSSSYNTRNTECYGVHGPSDELALLRLELARLGEECTTSLEVAHSAQSEPVLPLVDAKIAAASHIRIHGEPISLRLELEHEERALANQLLREAFEANAASARNEHHAQENQMRDEINEDASAALSQHRARFIRETETLIAKLKRDSVVAAQRMKGIESLAHEKMIIAMDRPFLQQEELYAKEVRQLREVERREAEVQMRGRMTAEKRVILPDEEMSTAQPYLLSSFERFIPYGATRM